MNSAKRINAQLRRIDAESPDVPRDAVTYKLAEVVSDDDELEQFLAGLLSDKPLIQLCILQYLFALGIHVGQGLAGVDLLAADDSNPWTGGASDGGVCE